MNQKIDGNNVTTEYRDWGEFLEAAKSGPTDLPKSQRRSRDTGDISFFGTSSFDEAVKIAERGYIERCEDAKKISMPLIDAISCRIEREEFVHDVEGTGIDVARFVDGEPECFIRPDVIVSDHGTGRKLIRMVLNASCSSIISSETIIRKGALAVALAELLELAGHRVEITVVDATRPDHGTCVCYMHIPIKAFDMPLNVPRLMFALGHPSMLRRLCFSVCEQLPATIRQIYGFSDGGGYGKAIDMPREKQGDIYFASVGLPHPDKTEAWMIEKLKEQGVILKQKESVR